MIRFILRFLLPIAIIGLAILGYGTLKSSPPEIAVEIPKARQWLVNAQRVQKQPLVPIANLFGRVVTPSSSILSSILDAEVVEINARPGQSVNQGDVLIRLDSQSIETQVRQIVADVARIQASIEREAQRLTTDQEILVHEERLRQLSSESLKRYESLKSRNVISQTEFDTAERNEQQARLAVTARRAAIREYDTRVAMLDAELRRAKATLDKARIDLSETIIVAPYSGHITDVHVAVGSQVRNGTAMIDMYDQTKVEVRTLIPSRFIEQVRQTIEQQSLLGAVAQLDGQQLELELDRLGDTVAPGRGGIDAYFHLSPDSAYPQLGRSVSLELSLTAIENAIALPYQSIYGSNHAFKIVSNQLQRIEVKRFGQIRRDQQTFVVATSENLDEGDLVLTTQLANANDGLNVKIADLE